MNRRVIGMTGMLALAAFATASAADIDWSRADQGLGKKGADQPGRVHKYGLPRSDLNVTLDGVTLKPALALGSWLAFQQAGDGAMVVGDLMGGMSSVAWSDEDDASGAALAKYLPTAKVTLQQGLTDAECQGKPISGKFEVDDGHFQLSVYTVQDGKFSEVLVDHNTGKVAKTEAITEGDDLADAKKQMKACAKATKLLQSAVDQAEQASTGYRGVSVTPKLSNGHAVAVVTLLKGTSTKSVSEPLE